MDPIKAARELGKAIQGDERYKAYFKAKEKNDDDAELQDLIGKFNLTRQSLQMEMNKNPDEQEKEKIEKLNSEMQQDYNKIMTNVNMAEFTIAKDAVDKMLTEVNQIISLCCDGEDPDTCEPQAADCSGSCSGCAGCG